MDGTAEMVIALEAAQRTAASLRQNQQQSGDLNGGHRGELAPRGEDPLQACMTFPVPGICYVATFSAALAKGWKMTGVRPIGRQGQFVEVKES